MPRIKELSPLAIKHEQEYGSCIKDRDNLEYVFHMQVDDPDVLDFSFLDYSIVRLTIHLPKDSKDCIFTVPKDIIVYGEDPFKSYAKVYVTNPDSSRHYKARNMIYETNHNKSNCNGAFSIKNMAWDLEKFPV